jgi:hypothetical protein
MSYLDRLRRMYNRPYLPPPEAEALRQLSQALLRWQQTLRLPAGPAPPPRRRVPETAIQGCIQLLKRRPALASAVGLGSEELARLQLAAIRMHVIAREARELDDTLRRCRRLLGERLAEGHAGLRRAMIQQATAKETPPGEALRLRAALLQDEAVERPGKARRRRPA